MSFKKNYIIIFFILSTFLFAGNSSLIYFDDIEFEMITNGFANKSYIHIHGDEETARMLLKDHIKTKKGRAFFIKSIDREVPLGPTKVDPNRIFSRSGSEKALKKFKPKWNQNKLDRLLDRLDQARKMFLINIFPSKGGLLIALHNNFRGYNVNMELDNSQLFSIKEDQNPRDFILCTSLEDYKKLENGPYNIVLQNKFNKNNNGSLSWAAMHHGVRYINIESRLGWLSQQRKMLYFVEDMLNN